MKYFIDTEFHEKPNTIQLISIGIVSEDGREYYAISKDLYLKEIWKNKWLRENVLLSIYIENIHGDARNRIPFTKSGMRRVIYSIGKPLTQIRSEIIKFMKGKPEFYGYYADYDWCVFCWIFGRMLDLPEGFPMYCRDLKQMLDDRGLTKKWTRQYCPDPANEHNALADASWNKRLFTAIKAYDETHGIESVKEWKDKFEEKARQKMNIQKQLETANQKLIGAGLRKSAIRPDASHAS